MADTGCKHNLILENEKLVPKENYLQNCYKIYKAGVQQATGSSGPPSALGGS